MTNLSQELSANQIGAIKNYLESLYPVVTFVKNDLRVGAIFSLELNNNEYPMIVTFTHENRLIMNTVIDGKTFRIHDSYESTKLEIDLFHIATEEEKERLVLNNFEMVNELDCLVFDKTYRIGVGYGSQLYHVHANCEQDALDILVDWFEEKEYYGMYSTYADIVEYHNDLNDDDEFEEMLDNYIVAGNHCHYIESDKLFIQEVR
jgi:hypothetical protein